MIITEDNYLETIFVFPNRRSFLTLVILILSLDRPYRTIVRRQIGRMAINHCIITATKPAPSLFGFQRLIELDVDREIPEKERGDGNGNAGSLDALLFAAHFQGGFDIQFAPQ